MHSGDMAQADPSFTPPSAAKDAPGGFGEWVSSHEHLPKGAKFVFAVDRDDGDGKALIALETYDQTRGFLRERSGLYEVILDADAKLHALFVLIRLDDRFSPDELYDVMKRATPRFFKERMGIDFQLVPGETCFASSMTEACNAFQPARTVLRLKLNLGVPNLATHQRLTADFAAWLRERRIEYPELFDNLGLVFDEEVFNGEPPLFMPLPIGESRPDGFKKRLPTPA